jgi:hypothetical protein
MSCAIADVHMNNTQTNPYVLGPRQSSSKVLHRTLTLAFNDAAFAHVLVVVAASQKLNYTVPARRLAETHTSQSIFHLRQTLLLLQLRIQDHRQSTSDSTILLICFLAVLAVVQRDHDGIVAHQRGLARVVSLRGGLGELPHRLALLVIRVSLIP